MLLNRRSELDQAYQRLCERGEQFAEPRPDTRLEGLTFDHPTAGQTTITIDEAALTTQGKIFAGDPRLRAALKERQIPAEGLDKGLELIGQHFEADDLVWGFSGFATGGYDYALEGQAISMVYEHLLATGNRPGLAVDGGVSAGNLGLNGVIAAMHGVPTIGMIPRQGLSNVGTRDNLLIWGDSYEDREILVGTTPDTLACIGGGIGTIRECQAALRQNTGVLLLAPKEYGADSLPATYQQYDEMAAATANGTMVVCRSVDGIPEAVEQILPTADKNRRSQRLDALRQLLTQNQ